MTPRVVVIGGGITGLTAAYRLAHADPPVDVLVLEAAPAAAGKVRSVTVEGLRLEAGPDSILSRKPWAVELCHELGLGDELVAAAAGMTQIWDGRRLLPFPSGPFGISTHPTELLRWPGMSLAAKLRASGDLVLPRRRATGDESLGSLLRRRLGDGATDALVAPLLGGLLGGDVDRLSVDATFPELAAWEREHGSLMRGARATAAARRTAAVSGSGSAGAPATFVRLRGGLERLTDALAGDLGSNRLRTDVTVRSIEGAVGGFVVEHDAGRERADGVLVATSSYAAAEVLARVAPEASERLRAIRYSSTAIALLVYPPGTGATLPQTSGFIAPRGTLPMTAATVVSRKWPDDALEGRAVLRCFIGSEGGGEAVLARDDDALLRDSAAALERVYRLPADAARGSVVRWPRAMPQYEVGHLDRVRAIEAALPAGIAVAGHAYRGVGLPDCVRQATEAAAGLRAAITSGRLA